MKLVVVLCVAASCLSPVGAHAALPPQRASSHELQAGAVTEQKSAEDRRGGFLDRWKLHLGDRPKQKTGLAVILLQILAGLCIGCCVWVILGICCCGELMHAIVAGAEKEFAKKLRRQFDEECPKSERHKYESEEFLLKCHDMFSAIDTNKTGTLDEDELQQGMVGVLGLNGLPIPASVLMKAFDLDEDHTIGEDEFVALMKWASFLKDKTEKEHNEQQSESEPVDAKDAMVRQLAEMECKSLGSCAPEERSALKRKILMKWHPDKQPSKDNAELATLVMQELQNRPEWKTGR